MLPMNNYYGSDEHKRIDSKNTNNLINDFSIHLNCVCSMCNQNWLKIEKETLKNRNTASFG